MADMEWFEVTGEGKFPNIEEARKAAREAARRSDNKVEIYRCSRTLVRTLQRTVTVQEVDTPSTLT